VTPLFAFGFGLDYTTFQMTRPSLRKISSGVRVELKVSNAGARAGADIVEAYVRYPASAGEPPEQLRSFTRVELVPGASRVVTLTIPASAFQVFRDGRYTTLAGRYGIDLGQSSSSLSLHLSMQLP
jgi:beta-glucosidase